MKKQIQDFLNNAFNSIEASFPNATIEYKYNDFTKSHIVKLTPSDTYYSNALLALKGRIYQSWLKIDTEEDFGIVTDDTIIDDSNMQLIYAPPVEVKFSFDSSEGIVHWKAEIMKIETDIDLGNQVLEISDFDFTISPKLGMAA